MRDDAELLRCYACENSESAFGELVRRHLGLVYNAALRQVGGDAHLAEDVAQRVFTDLARKASSLSGRAVFTGWLYTSTRFAAAQIVRGERRRRAREQEALRMNEHFSESARPLAESSAVDWDNLKPVIDDALHALGERDREAVLLRFFEGRPFAEVGAKLVVSEDAARMRVERALEKLRRSLARHGVTSTSAALAIALGGQAMAAPAGLAVSVTAGALSQAAAMTTAAGWMTFMGMTKLQAGLAAAIIAGGAGGFLLQERDAAALRLERDRIHISDAAQRASIGPAAVDDARDAEELRELRKDDVELARLEVELETLKRGLAANLAARERLRAAGAVTSEEKPFKVSEIDVIPQVKTHGAPMKFPHALRQAGIEGQAVVRFVVDKNGAVSRAEAVKSSHEAFAAVATEAVKQWGFEAGEKAGAPVNVEMVVPIVFSLGKEDGGANNWF